MSTIIRPPTPIQATLPLYSIFLAGSFEMGAAVPWQARVEQELADGGMTIFNPRRPDWDPGWVQSADNPQFREQVEWELDALERSNLIAVYFDPPTKSPITLLELGLFARSVQRQLLVCCPEGFWRKGNVDIVCRRYSIEQAPDLDAFVLRLKQMVALP